MSIGEAIAATLFVMVLAVLAAEGLMSLARDRKARQSERTVTVDDTPWTRRQAV